MFNNKVLIALLFLTSFASAQIISPGGAGKTPIKDANGNTTLDSSSTASAVDAITITNAATANPATVDIGASGTDSNINVSITPKGTGQVKICPSCTNAGFYQLGQGTTNATGTTAVTLQAPTAVTSYVVTLPGAAASGALINVNASNVITQSFSGDAAHSISQTAKTAAITTATLCAATAGTACGQAGQYRVHWNFYGSGTACSSVTAGSVTFLLTWTDPNAVTHSAVALQMMSQTGAATMATQSTFPFQTALANESASGDFTFSTNGTIIQYATGYTACTTGTGTYNLKATVEQLQ